MPHEHALQVSEPNDGAVSLARLYLHLKEGWPVYVAADGRWSTSLQEFDFFDRQVRLRTALPALLRAVNATSATAFAVWNGDRLVLHREELPEISDPAGELTWANAYVAELERVCLADPANLGLRGGIWVPGDGGVFAG